MAKRKTTLETLRESERILALELKRLRGKIAIAERGENKRIKDTLAYIKKQNREIAKVRVVEAKVQEQELKRLEKFLGESFDSLREARKAFKLETVKPTKKELAKEGARLRSRGRVKEATRFEKEAGTFRVLDKNKSYKVRQLSAIEKQDVIDFLSDKKSFDEIGSGYLDKGEVITVNVGYKYRGLDGRLHNGKALGKKVVNSWSALYTYLNEYNSDTESEEWIGDIEIVKFHSTNVDTARDVHRIAKGRQIDTQEKRRKEVTKMYDERRKKKYQKKVERVEARAAKQKEKAAKREAKLKAQITKLKGAKKK